MGIPKRRFFKSPVKWGAAVLSETLAKPILQAYRGLAVARGPTPSESWRRGILLGADHIGDVLYRTSSLERLSQILPQCQWDWATRPPSDQVIRHNPYIKRTLTIPDGCSNHDLAAMLRDQAYDVALCYDTGAYEQLLHVCLKAKIPNRIGYTHKGLSAWVTHPARFAYPQSYPGYFRNLVADFGSLSPDWSLRPQVFTTEADEKECHEFLYSHDISAGSKILACFVTSRQPEQSVWSTENFLTILAEIVKDPTVTIVLCGAKSDQAALEACRQRLSPTVIVNAGQLALPSLVCFLQKCKAVLTTDSGPRHLSNAAGTPAVFVHNPLFHPLEAGAYCETDNDFAEYPAEERIPAMIGRLKDLLSVKSEKKPL